MFGTLFKIKEGEEKLVFVSLLQSFFIGLPRLFTVTTAAALFLKYYDAVDLPYVYILTALMLPLFGFLYQYLQGRLAFIKLQGVTLLILFLVSVLLRTSLAFLENKWTVALLMAWVAVEWILTNLVYQNTHNVLFTVEQKKRLSGSISSGETVAAVLGGLTIAMLVEQFGLANLLIFSQIGLLLALVNLSKIERDFAPESDPSEDPLEALGKKSATSYLSLLRNRYPALIVIFYAIQAYIGFFLVDNIFYLEIEGKYPDPTDLVVFLGQFWALVGIITLFYRTIVSSQWIAQLGLLGGLISSPIAIALGAGLIIFTGVYSNELLPVFWLAVFIKVLDQIFTHTISNPAYQTLYQPLSSPVRLRLQVTAGTFAGALAGGVTGIVMLLLTKVADFGSVDLAKVLIVVVMIQGGICFLLSKDYQTALASVLKRRGLTAGSDLNLNDPASLLILENGLGSHHTREVLYCVQLLQEVEHPRRDALLLGLIEHKNAQVRTAVFQAMEKLAKPTFYDPLLGRLDEEKNPTVWAALVSAIAVCQEGDVIDLIEPYMKHPHPDFRAGAMVSAIRYGGIQGAVQAGSILLKLEASRIDGERRFAARILGNIGIRSFYRGLITLLEDKSLEVREEALIASEKVANPRLWPYVIENLAEPSVRDKAVRALVSAGESAYPAMESAFEEESQTHTVRRQIILIFGKSRSSKAIPFLLKHLYGRVSEEYYETLEALLACGYRTAESDLGKINRLIEEEVIYGRKVIIARNDLTDDEDCALLYSTLTNEIEKTQKGSFFLLSYIYPAEIIQNIRNNYYHPSAETREIARSLMARTLSPAHRRLIAPIFNIEKKTGEPDPEAMAERVHEMISRIDKWKNPWVRACAVDLAFKIYPPELRERMVQNMYDSSEVVMETARYQFSQKDPDQLKSIGMEVSSDLPRIEKVKFLKTVDVFSEMPDEILAHVASYLKEVRYDKEIEVIRKDVIGTSMYIIAEGLLRVHDGDTELARLGVGGIFGEFSALDPEPRTASVTTVRPSHLFSLSHEDMTTFMSERNDFARDVIQHLCRRLQLALKKQTSEDDEDTAERQRLTIDPFRHSADPFRLEDKSYLTLIEKVIILKTAKIFANTPDNVIAGIAALTEEVYLKQGETLFEKDELGTKMYIVVDGRVKVHDEERTIAELGARALIGELAALSSEPRTATITAVDGTSLLALDQAALFNFMWDQPEIVQGIITVILARLRNLRKS